MRYLNFLFMGMCCLYVAAAQKPNTVVKASFTDIKAGEWIYISKLGGGPKDSVKTTGKGFTHKWYMPETEGDIYILHLGDFKRPGSAMLAYIQPGEMMITSKGPGFSNATLSGSRYAVLQQEYLQLSAANREKKQSDSLSRLYRTAQLEKQSEQVLADLRGRVKQLDSLSALADKQWILKYANEPVVAYPLYMSLRNNASVAEQEAILTQLTPEVRSVAPIKRMEYTIKMSKALKPGMPAPDFIQNDTAGKPIALHNFRGKYVLIDFWASWCVPCRAENPNVVKAFQQYRDKGFTVLGVSFDREGQYDKWLAAIHADHLDWTHVSDLKHWDNAIGKLYDIHAIPSNFLVNPEGIIVGVNLRGEALDTALEGLLNKTTKR